MTCTPMYSIEYVEFIKRYFHEDILVSVTSVKMMSISQRFACYKCTKKCTNYLEGNMSQHAVLLDIAYSGVENACHLDYFTTHIWSYVSANNLLFLVGGCRVGCGSDLYCIIYSIDAQWFRI